MSSSVLIGAVHFDPGGLFIAFGAGILSFASPCVLPLVPGYVSLVAGVRTGDLDEGSVALGKLLRSILFFIAGFTVVFVILGASATAIGSTLVRNQRDLETVAGVVTILVGILFISGASPRVLNVEKRFHVSPSALGVWAPPIMGMAFAFGWTPCIGPVLGAVLAAAAARTTLAGGIALLFVYSLGLGVPFAAAGLAWGKATAVMSWAKKYFRTISVVSGLVLAGWGVLMVSGEVSLLSIGFSHLLRDIGLTRLTVS